MQYFTESTPLPPYLPYPRFLLRLSLSDTAKLLYSLILSRIHLSQSNGWADAGRVYCRYTIKDLMADTGKSKTTIVTALADLESHELLYRRRGGAGYANMLYLRFPDSYTSEEQRTAPQKTGKSAPNKKKNKIPDYDYMGDSL